MNDVSDELDQYGLTPDVIDGLLYSEERDSASLSERKRSTPGQMLQLTSPVIADLQTYSHRNSAVKWVQSLPRDERFVKKTSFSRKRRYSVGAADLRLFHSESSPNTYFAETNLPAPVATPSPSKSPSRRHSFGGSGGRSSSGDFDLPPLVLPVGALHEPHDSNDRPKPYRKLSHDYASMDWMQKKVPEFLPEDSTSSLQLSDDSNSGVTQGPWIKTKSGRRARAEYELLDASFRLQPKIVLHVESPNIRPPMDSPETSSSEHHGSSSSSTPRTTHTPHTSHTPRNSITAFKSLRGSMQGLDLGSPAQDLPTVSTQSNDTKEESPTTYHHRRILILLKNDQRFFESLVSAIRTLLQLHVLQQRTLTRHVEALCNTITEVASPVNSAADMYVWREIFALWLEFDIFESSREKDRGELSVAASEARLHKYLEQLEKRGLLMPHQSFEREGKTLASTLDSWALQAFSSSNPLSDPRSIATLEHFLRLNVALVSIKRFERLNIETIRKLLKKHTKKTALHVNNNISKISLSSHAHQLLRAASLDSAVPEYDWDTASAGDVLKSLTALAPVNDQSSFQLSLPRIVASLLTTALLPVLPSVDDYSCLVCMSIAWHPIRLNCGHLFCIRCLVKLQKQGTNDCPLCRHANAVRDADENNLDLNMANYLKQWFPREIEEKTEENRSDRQLQEQREKQLRKKNRWARFRSRHHAENERDHDCTVC